MPLISKMVKASANLLMQKRVIFERWFSVAPFDIFSLSNSKIYFNSSNFTRILKKKYQNRTENKWAFVPFWLPYTGISEKARATTIYPNITGIIFSRILWT